MDYLDDSTLSLCTKPFLTCSLAIFYGDYFIPLLLLNDLSFKGLASLQIFLQALYSLKRFSAIDLCTFRFLLLFPYFYIKSFCYLIGDEDSLSFDIYLYFLSTGERSKDSRNGFNIY